VIDGIAYFVAHHDRFGREIWRSDGTAAGTFLLCDLVPGPPDGNPTNLVEMNGLLFFTSSYSSLWKSDGTAEGTYEIPLPGVSPFNHDIDHLVNVNGTLYFAARGENEGTELWKSDGTAAGTGLLKDIRPGTAYSAPLQLVNVGGRLFCTADDGVHGRGTDGSFGPATGRRRGPCS
jgi:ELWxxDGT repeat protein